MGRSIAKIKTGGLPMPVVPTENKGIMSGPIRKPRRQGRRMRPRGSVKPSSVIGQRPLRRGEKEFMDRLTRDREAGITRTPEEESKLRREILVSKRERRGSRRGSTGRRMLPKDRPLTGGYNPRSGVRYTDTGVPTAVQSTRRVAVQDPTLGGPPEREVPMPRERRQRITRESDPRGGAPFSPDERGMARDRFFERMFERADERKQQKSMERAERDNVGDALRSERELRASEVAGPGDERGGRRGEGGMRRRRRRGGGMRRRRGRRRDFTRRRSQMEGGRRGRSGREMAEFRDQYVSTLR
jgi:hypothetical protein